MKLEYKFKHESSEQEALDSLETTVRIFIFIYNVSVWKFFLLKKADTLSLMYNCYEQLVKY